MNAWNLKRWKAGDYVLHDADAKKPEMLMLVVQVVESPLTTIYTTVYLTDDNRQQWENHEEYLHSPHLFGIEVSNGRAYFS
jgi:hypothetical protein